MKKKIPFSNYFKLIVVVVITVLIALILRNWYLSRMNYEKNISILGEKLQMEIVPEEVYDYVREKGDVVLYFGVVDNDECRNFEKDFQEFVEEQDLEEVITYVNLTKLSNKKSFIKEFNKFYGSEVKGYPSFIVFEDGKVEAVLTVDVGEELKVPMAKTFFHQNKIASDLYD